jgi:drug/metabolite transporter (DMT)-like permease
MRVLPLAASAATGILVGSAMVATRFVVDQTGPASLALLRYAIGFCCLLPVVLLSADRTRFARRDLLPIALLGITQFGILIALLNYGLRFIPSGRAALIFATFPLLTLVLAAALGHEQLTLPKILGVLLTIAGVGLALGEKAIQGGARMGGRAGRVRQCRVRRRLQRAVPALSPEVPGAAGERVRHARVGGVSLAPCRRRGLLRVRAALHAGRVDGRRLHRPQ